MNGRSSPTHPTPNTHKAKGVQEPPRQSRGLRAKTQPLRLASSLRVWTASPPTSRHQGAAPPGPGWFSEPPNALSQDSGGD